MSDKEKDNPHGKDPKDEIEPLDGVDGQPTGTGEPGPEDDDDDADGQPTGTGR
jgi:hypothetical protein